MSNRTPTARTLPPGPWACHAPALDQLLGALQAGGSMSGRPSAAGSPMTIRNGLAVIELSGALTKSRGWLQEIFGNWSMAEVGESVEAAAGDPAVREILLRVESPGGTADGTDDLAEQVHRATKRKTVTAYADGLMASAAYYIASQATRVVASRSALVGSIGTYATLYDLSGMMAQKGIKVHVVKAGAHKAAGAPGTEIKPEDLLEVQRTVDGVNALFLSAVRRGRPKMNLEAVADGRVFLGREALALGLVDGVESWGDLLARLDPPAPPVKPRKSAREILESVGAATLKQCRRALKERFGGDHKFAMASHAGRLLVERIRALEHPAEPPPPPPPPPAKPISVEEAARHAAQTWELAVSQNMAAAGGARNTAIRMTIRQRPDLHRQYLETYTKLHHR